MPPRTLISVESPQPRVGEVYTLTNLVNGKIYVGKSMTGAAVRWRGHKHCYKREKQAYLYRAMRKHGIENFQLTVIDTAAIEADLSAKEIRWIAHFDSTNPEKGYNSTTGGEGFLHGPSSLALVRGIRIVSAETRKKLSDRMKARMTPEFRHKLSEQNKKRVAAIPAEERKALAIKAAMVNADRARGKKRDPEIGKKISAASMGRSCSEDEKRRLRTVNLGRKQSAEEIARRAESNRKAWLDVDKRATQAQVSKEKYDKSSVKVWQLVPRNVLVSNGKRAAEWWNTPAADEAKKRRSTRGWSEETRRKIAATREKLWTPEKRAEMSAKMKQVRKAMREEAA